ncbi:GNAT family N-acetyltransferase [Ileibacterium valens]|uniref:GNAT family N-acetyltransferase n=1 Tax=Ileibacterium valens TaxID=1862668 RepID=UPI00272CD5B3|nr:GNAT family N-acetyltransferase [Ileibacterium valens]
MIVVEFFSMNQPTEILEQIKDADWSGAKSLSRLLEEGSFHDRLGENARLLLLMEDEELAAFCTFADHDDVPDTNLAPWIGYVYTSEKFRGKRCAGQLIEAAERMAREDNDEYVYISTGHRGLYEKYGYELFTTLKNKHGQDSGIYRKKIK